MGQRVLICGGGVGGLTTALALSRAGHEVSLVERVPIEPLASPEEAFATERRGAPQIHHTHGFLARLQVTLRDRFPDVLAELLAAGGTTMPMTAALGEPRPGDEDLKVIVVRRSTYEWVLRRAVQAQPHVSVRTGVGVDSLFTTRDDEAGRPVVSGVRLDDGTLLEADAVVAATGVRGPILDWLSALDVEVPETTIPSGLTYLTRWYSRRAAALPPDPKLGGDLGFVKYLAVPGDGDTLSVTLAVPADDHELRKLLLDPDRFQLACELLPGPDLFFHPEAPRLEPIGGVRPMAGLINRTRRFMDDDGTPLVVGFHALGDAHTTTNPLYGRGCSLATVQACLLADAFTDHPDDPVARAVAYETGNAREVEPWYESAVQMDQLGADPAGTSAFGGGDDAAAGKAMAAVFVAAATDPVIGRGIARFMNLLQTPAQLLTDGELMVRVAEVMADPDAHPTPPRTGPKRRELVQRLTEAAA